MTSYVTCPTCGHNLGISEGGAGKRHVCPRCDSPFVAGAAPAAAAEAPADRPSYDKTMLGQTAPPIRYTCPRCRMALEDPATEAGTKKPCPGCGQRVQVPPAPPAAPPTPAASPAAAVNAAGPPVGRPAGDTGRAERRERCLECGRDVTEFDEVFSCHDCGAAFCSGHCIREHRYHSHRRRRREPVDFAPQREPETDNTGLIVGLTVGGIFFFILLFVVFFAIALN